MYNEKGLQGLNPDRPSRRPSRLTEEQQQDVRKTVQMSPRNLGFKFSNWNCKNLSVEDLLMFLDEVSVKQHPNIQPKWAQKGSKEYIGTFGNHAKVNVLGAINHALGKTFHMKWTKRTFL